MEFSKYEATANDFLMIDGTGADISLGADDIRALCDRRRGVGADGVILMLPSRLADLGMRIFNADGSEAQMCGNGLRALLLFALDRGVAEEAVSVETLAGVRSVARSASADGLPVFTAGMGLPALRRSEIPMEGNPDDGAVGVMLELPGGETLSATCASMGNPHCVVFVDDLEGYPVDRIGPLVEGHPLFPERTNVEFVRVENEGSLAARVWERGVGETMACGTGACAALVAAHLEGRARKRATVSLPGGDLLVEWLDEGLTLSGPARHVFDGKTV